MGNLWFLAAGVVVFATVAVHAVAGGAKVLKPLFATDIAPPLKWMGALSWHTGTVAMSAMGAGFIAGALDEGRAELALIATALAAAFLGLGVYVGLRSGLGLTRFPVVPLFTVVVVLGVVGGRV